MVLAPPGGSRKLTATPRTYNPRGTTTPTTLRALRAQASHGVAGGTSARPRDRSRGPRGQVPGIGPWDPLGSVPWDPSVSGHRRLVPRDPKIGAPGSLVTGPSPRTRGAQGGFLLLAPNAPSQTPHNQDFQVFGLYWKSNTNLKLENLGFGWFGKGP
jgi:hypothetical protein